MPAASTRASIADSATSGQCLHGSTRATSPPLLVVVSTDAVAHISWGRLLLHFGFDGWRPGADEVVSDRLAMNSMEST
jgi:hypothetical protein